MTDCNQAASPIRSYGAPMLSSRAAAWGGVRATVIRRERIEAVVQRFRLPWHAFRLGLSGAFERGSTTRLGNLPPAALSPPTGGASFYPAGTEVINEVTGASRLTYLMVEIERDASEEDGWDGSGQPPVVDLADPLCLTLLRDLMREVERPTTSQGLFCETAGLMLLLAVSRSQASRARVPRPGGLSARQLARATDYIGDRMTREVSLGEVAAVLGLSRSHLCRTFKASTGLTLHRWQTDARLGRAKDLMRDGDLSLAQVASAVGFADQSHFTAAFRRFVGVTPRAWRREYGRMP